MSFIVFSTEGRILMSLTEDRWVRIRFRVALNPFLSHHQAAENECNTRFGCRSHTVRIPLKYSVQEEIPDGYFPFIAIWLWCCWSGQLLNCIVCVILRAGRVTVSLLPSSFWTSASSPLSLCVTVSQASANKYCFNSFICYSLLVFSGKNDFIGTIILLPRLAVSVCRQKVNSKWISSISLDSQPNGLPRLLCVFSGNAFAKVLRSSRGFFQGEIPSCMRASWGWDLCTGSRTNTTQSSELNGSYFALFTSLSIFF